MSSYHDEALLNLRDEYHRLPPQRVRWSTAPGVEFLDRLFEATDQHSTAVIAEAIGVSVQGIYYMLRRPRPVHPRPWPTTAELADFTTAHNGHPRDYLGARSALKILIKKYAIDDLKYATGVDARTIKRYIDSGEGDPRQH